VYCPNCGAQNLDEAQFCFSCGRALGAVDAAAVAEPGKVPGRLIAWSLICAAIALVFVPPVFGGIAVYLGWRARKYNEGMGTTLMIVAGVATAIGMGIGALVFVSAGV
jgi:hypothetical protein